MTGSAMLPVIAAEMSGIARIEASVTKTVITPMMTITPTIARGTFLAGARTSPSGAGGSEAEKRPAHEGNASDPPNPQPIEAAVRGGVVRIEQRREIVDAEEEEEGNRQSERRGELRHEEAAEEKLEDRLGDAVDRQADDHHDDGQHDECELRSIGDTHPWEEEARRGVGTRGHGKNHSPTVSPGGEPTGYGTGLPARPLIDAALERPCARHLSEDQGNQELTNQHDVKTPEERRAGGPE